MDKKIKVTEIREMDNYLAVALAEGFEEANSREEVIAAWQYIWDTGIWRTLQGWFGRTVHQLAEEGIING